MNGTDRSREVRLQPYRSPRKFPCWAAVTYQTSGQRENKITDPVYGTGIRRIHEEMADQHIPRNPISRVKCEALWKQTVRHADLTECDELWKRIWMEGGRHYFTSSVMGFRSSSLKLRLPQPDLLYINLKLIPVANMACYRNKSFVFLFSWAKVEKKSQTKVSYRHELYILFHTQLFTRQEPACIHNSATSDTEIIYITLPRIFPRYECCIKTTRDDRETTVGTSTNRQN